MDEGLVPSESKQRELIQSNEPHESVLKLSSVRLGLC